MDLTTLTRNTSRCDEYGVKYKETEKREQLCNLGFVSAENFNGMNYVRSFVLRSKCIAYIITE